MFAQATKKLRATGSHLVEDENAETLPLITSMDGIGRGSRQGFQGFQTNPSQSVNLNGQFQCDILDLLVEPEQVVVSDISVVGVADSNVAEVANSEVVSHLSNEVVRCGGGAREGLGKGDSLVAGGMSVLLMCVRVFGG